MKQVDALREVLPAQAEVQRKVPGDLVVILEVEGPVRFFEGDVRISVGQTERSSCRPGRS